MKTLASVSLASLILLASASASAAVCVHVDEERDNLESGERQVIKTMVEESLRNQGESVTRDNCQETYTIYSLKLGNSVTAHISGPSGSKSQKANGLEDLPDTYDQLVRSVLSGTDGQMAGTDRTNVTKEQAAPRRLIADNLWFLRLGYGAIVGGNFSSGPAFGLGYRHELDQFGLEISGFNMIVGGDQLSDGDVGITGSWIKLSGLYFFEPTANNSPYVSAGLSWGATGVTSGEGGSRQAYGGSGLQGEISGGYEFLRASTIRLFLEANAVLPFYTSKSSFLDSSDSIYNPSFTLSVGVGYGSANRTAIETY